MTKYISKENLQYYDSKFKEYVDTKLQNIEYLLAYGVEWDINVADPHITRIGNDVFHKTLPIQSQMKGCIAQHGVVKYWLNEDNWEFRKNPIYLEDKNYDIEVIDDTSFTIQFYIIIQDDIFSTKQYQGSSAHFIHPNFPEVYYYGRNAEINTQNNTAKYYVFCSYDDYHMMPELFKVELGSVRNGYDGTVKVYTPEFYIKSEEDGDKRRVWISTMKLGDNWLYQEPLLIDAYKPTTLREVPTNMGFLSTLVANSVVSIVNTETYCRGGTRNNTTYDKYLTGDDTVEKDIFRTLLGKPVTQLGRNTMRVWCRLNGDALLSYEQYKNIFYWLYVIEYANFNCQEYFTTNLTSQGYKQGGLGSGITTMGDWNTWAKYNGDHPLTPCGYGDEFGNNTKTKALVIPAYSWEVSAIDNLKNGTVRSGCGSITDGKVTITKITYTTSYMFYAIAYNIAVKATYRVTGLNDSGETLIFFSNNTKVGEISADGDIEITWPETYSDRQFRFSTLNNNVNITIEVIAAEAGIITKPSVTMNMPRWRGFDNPFGDTYTNLDGVIVDADIHQTNMDYVYICNNPEQYADTLTENYIKVAEKVHTDGYVKHFDLGERADIIARSVGGSTSTYKCDYNYCGTKNNQLRTLLVGGSADDGATAGLAGLRSSTGVGAAGSSVAFRSVSSFSSAEN